MTDDTTHKETPGHLRMRDSSRWFARFQPLIKQGGSVLDLAAGGGRNAMMFADAGHAVTAVERNAEALGALAQIDGVEAIEADLEIGSPWPFAERRFDAVAVCNYLYRPLFDDLIGALAPGGVLLYETFATGNEVYGKPRNPDHLLKSGELLSLVDGRLQVIAYAHGVITDNDMPGVKQTICAVNNLPASADDAPKPVDLPD